MATPEDIERYKDTIGLIYRPALKEGKVLFMPPKRGAEGTPEEWLRRAKGNLALAKQRKPKEAYWEDLCFEELWFMSGTFLVIEDAIRCELSGSTPLDPGLIFLLTAHLAKN